MTWNRQRPPRFSTVQLTQAIRDDAAHLSAVHGLRSYDAVQLSSALAARRADPSCATFAVFDGTLRSAASVEGSPPTSSTGRTRSPGAARTGKTERTRGLPRYGQRLCVVQAAPTGKTKRTRGPNEPIPA